MVGISAGIRSVEDEITQTQQGNSGVLLTGEHGVGKSLVARLIHGRSPRAAGPFIAAACSGLPQDELESRLFGPEYGTAPVAPVASDAAESWLEAADGGTLFVDGVGELGMRTQGTLLRFLEKGEQQRVPPGRRPDRRRPPIDVRIVAATHRNLMQAVAEKKFLEHLYYRLNVVHIQIPPLRERREDVPVLMEHFVRMFADAHQRPVPDQTPDALALLMAYQWPDNVRELRELSEALVLQGVSRIDRGALPARVRHGDAAGRAASAPVPARSVHEDVFARILEGGETFWSGVYEPFMTRDLTRADVRAIVAMALECSEGSFKAFAERLGVQPRDYKKLDAFLRKCECKVQLPRLRMASTPYTPRMVRSRRASA